MALGAQPWPVQEYDRKRLLERVEREGATVGADIPERIEVAGEPLPLKEFVFEVKRLDEVPADTRAEVMDAKRQLRRERRARKQELEDADIPRSRGEELAEAIVGIDRALNALESLGPTDIEGEIASQEAADTKRWVSFLQQVLGRDDSDTQRGVRR